MLLSNMSKMDTSMDYIYVHILGHLLRVTSLPLKIFFYINYKAISTHTFISYKYIAELLPLRTATGEVTNHQSELGLNLITGKHQILSAVYQIMLIYTENKKSIPSC